MSADSAKDKCDVTDAGAKSDVIGESAATSCLADSSANRSELVTSPVTNSPSRDDESPTALTKPASGGNATDDSGGNTVSDGGKSDGNSASGGAQHVSAGADSGGKSAGKLASSVDEAGPRRHCSSAGVSAATGATAQAKSSPDRDLGDVDSSSPSVATVTVAEETNMAKDAMVGDQNAGDKSTAATEIAEVVRDNVEESLAEYDSDGNGSSASAEETSEGHVQDSSEQQLSAEGERLGAQCDGVGVCVKLERKSESSESNIAVKGNEDSMEETRIPQDKQDSSSNDVRPTDNDDSMEDHSSKTDSSALSCSESAPVDHSMTADYHAEDSVVSNVCADSDMTSPVVQLNVDSEGDVQQEDQQAAAEDKETPTESTAELVELHCLVCNVAVTADQAVQLCTQLDTFKVRVADKLADVVNKDYKLYLHSELVCDNCLNVLTEIHHQEVETKRLKDLVVGDFWDTVETRGVRPQRRGRKRSQTSKLLLEEDEKKFVPEMMRYQDPPDVGRTPPKKSKNSSASGGGGSGVKSKVYIKLGACSYQCVRCLKCFPRMRTVVKHYNIVHGKNEVQCRLCDKFFRDRTHLQKHKKRFHSDSIAAGGKKKMTSKCSSISCRNDRSTARKNITSDRAKHQPQVPTLSSLAAAVLTKTAVASGAANHEDHEDDDDVTRRYQRHLDGEMQELVEGLGAGLVESRLSGEDDDQIGYHHHDDDEDEYDDEDYDDEVAEGGSGGGGLARTRSRRTPVIAEDDDDVECDADGSGSAGGGGVSLDMDVVMNVNGDTETASSSGRRRQRRRQSDVARDNRHMFSEVSDSRHGFNVTRYQCLLCTNSYSRQAKARDHFMAKHAQLRRFACSVCAQMFLTYKQKRHHELSHTAEACAKCGKKYPGNRRGMLERHMIQCGQLKKCKTCDAEFGSVDECLRHRREVHDKTAACEVCGKVVSARNLASHRAIHSDERNYTCHLCGASFKAKGSLDTHLRTHSEERPFSCATCGRSFKHRNNWKDHERSHLNIRDFVCHFCSKTFKQAKNLKQHLRQHDANPEIFTCPHCPSTFKYKYNMLAHVKTLHTGEMGRRVRRRVRTPADILNMATSAAAVSSAHQQISPSPANIPSSSSPSAVLHQHAVLQQQQQQQQQHAHGGHLLAPSVVPPQPPQPPLVPPHSASASLSSHLQHQLHQHLHHHQQQQQQQQQQQHFHHAHHQAHQQHQPQHHHQQQQQPFPPGLLAMSGISNSMHISPVAAAAAAAALSADQLSAPGAAAAAAAAAAQAAAAQAAPASASQTQAGSAGGHVVFMPTLQHHSIFS